MQENMYYILLHTDYETYLFSALFKSFCRRDMTGRQKTNTFQFSTSVKPDKK